MLNEMLCSFPPALTNCLFSAKNSDPSATHQWMKLYASKHKGCPMDTLIQECGPATRSNGSHGADASPTHLRLSWADTPFQEGNGSKPDWTYVTEVLVLNG